MRTSRSLLPTTVTLAVLGGSAMAADSSVDTLSYPIVDTNKTQCLDDDRPFPAASRHVGHAGSIRVAARGYDGTTPPTRRPPPVDEMMAWSRLIPASTSSSSDSSASA